VKPTANGKFHSDIQNMLAPYFAKELEAYNGRD